MWNFDYIYRNKRTDEVRTLFAVGLFIGSLFAGWSRPRLGSLVPLILLHNVSNLVIPLVTLWLS